MLEFPDWRCVCLDRSAVILAVDSSVKFSGDKGLLDLHGKPLINHVIDAVKGLVDEIIVVTGSQQCADLYEKVVSSDVKFVVDDFESKGLLAGVIAGFGASQSEYSALLPFDSPFVSQEVMSLLFDCAIGKTAVIPRSTDMECEPLHAVYHTKQALQATNEALAENEVDLQGMVDRLHGVRYMSMMVITQLDPDLKTFFRVKTTFDLKKAEVMGKERKTSKTKKPVKRKR
jgi:molybdopterin-guanine dinucleotide biosynthesis protein A